MYGTRALLCVSGTPTREDDTCEARMAQYRVSLISETRMAQYLLLLFSETRMAQYRYLLPLFSETRMAQYRVSLIPANRRRPGSRRLPGGGGRVTRPPEWVLGRCFNPSPSLRWEAAEVRRSCPPYN